jgi:hypothetical protein
MFGGHRPVSISGLVEVESLGALPLCVRSGTTAQF